MTTAAEWYTSTETALESYVNNGKLSASKKPQRAKQKAFYADLKKPAADVGINDEAEIIGYFSHYARLLDLTVEIAGNYGTEDDTTYGAVDKAAKDYKNNPALSNPTVKFYANLLLQLRDFELAIYDYDGLGQVQVQHKLTQLQAAINANECKVDANTAYIAAVVLSKFIQLKHRITAQFENKFVYQVGNGNQRTDLSFTTITQSFEDKLKKYATDHKIHGVDYYTPRIQAIVQQSNLQEKQEADVIYKPGFWTRLWRKYSPFASNKSWFQNDTEERSLWSNNAAKVRQRIFGNFITANMKNLTSDNQEIETSLKEDARKAHDASSFKNVTKSFFSGIYNQLTSVLGSNAAPQNPGAAVLPVEPVNEQPLTVKTIKLLNVDVFRYMLRAFKFPESTDARKIFENDNSEGKYFTSHDLHERLNEHVPPPELPIEFPIAGSQEDNPEKLKLRAKQTAICIRKIMESAFAINYSEGFEVCTKKLANFVLPALQRMRDMNHMNRSANFTSAPKDFIGLQFYKDFLAELFNGEELQILKGQFTAGSAHADLKDFWSNLKEFNDILQENYASNPEQMILWNSAADDQGNEKSAEEKIVEAQVKAREAKTDDEKRAEATRKQIGVADNINKIDRAIDALEENIWKKLDFLPKPEELFGTRAGNLTQEADRTTLANKQAYIQSHNKASAKLRYKLRQIIQDKLRQDNGYAAAQPIAREGIQARVDSSIKTQLEKLKTEHPDTYINNQSLLPEFRILAVLNYMADAEIRFCGGALRDFVQTRNGSMPDYYNAGMYYTMHPEVLSRDAAFPTVIATDHNVQLFARTQLELCDQLVDLIDKTLIKGGANQQLIDTVYTPAKAFIKGMYRDLNNGRYQTLSDTAYPHVPVAAPMPTRGSNSSPASASSGNSSPAHPQGKREQSPSNGSPSGSPKPVKV